MDWTSAIGRRKEAVARVFMMPGKGTITVNNKPLDDYFSVNHVALKALEPLAIVEGTGKYDIKINVNGGGIKGQAEAIRLGIGRALCKIDEEMRPALKAEGVLRRDARVVERKKPGLKKARKKTQFSKR